MNEMNRPVSWLNDKQERLRRTHPTLWHLKTLYVLTFGAVGCLLAFAVAVLVPIDNRNITPVEPPFFAILFALLMIALAWLANLLRPLRPEQTFIASREPLLVLCALHAALLVAPAFVFGATLQYRITDKLYLADALLWREVLQDHVTTRLNESSLALAGFAKKVDDADVAFNPFRPVGAKDDKGINENKFWKSHQISGLNTVLGGDRRVFYYVETPAVALTRSRSAGAPPEAAADMLKQQGMASLQVAMDGWSWCGFARLLLAPLSNEKAMASATDDSDIAMLLTSAATAATEGRDSKPLSPYSTEQFNALIEALIGKRAIKSLPVVAAEDKQEIDGRSSFPNLEFAKPVSSEAKSTVTLICNVEFKGKLLQLARKELKAHDKEFETTNIAYDRIVERIVARHGHAAPAIDAGSQLLKIEAITEDMRKMIKATSSVVQQHTTFMNTAYEYLESVIFAFAGANNTVSQTTSFPWLTDWYWFASGFVLCGAAFALTAIAFLILCIRSASDRETRSASWIAGILTAVLLASYLIGNNSLGITVIFFGVAGVACWAWAASVRRVTPLHKVACLSFGLTLPFILIAAGVQVLKSCSRREDELSDGIVVLYACGGFGDLRLTYMAGAVAALIVAGELFLLVWRRIAVKPS
jgi:hypothetical protein